MSDGFNWRIKLATDLPGKDLVVHHPEFYEGISRGLEGRNPIFSLTRESVGFSLAARGGAQPEAEVEGKTAAQAALRRLGLDQVVIEVIDAWPKSKLSLEAQLDQAHAFMQNLLNPSAPVIDIFKNKNSRS